MPFRRHGKGGKRT